MDFMNAYSSALSSENSKSDSEQRKQTEAAEAAALPTYVPFKTQPPEEESGSESELSTQQLSSAAHPPTSIPKSNSTSFTQLFDDAIYVFRKNALQAVELGIGEMIAEEKTRLTSELMNSQHTLQECQQERAELKKMNEEEELQLLRQQEIMSKMAENISELKVYRTDSLYGQRVLRAWGNVARHNAKSRDYENLLEDLHATKSMRNTFSQWKFLAYKKSFIDLRENFNIEIEKLSDEREQFFAAERTRYESKIEELKREMSGFAVKEKKMKDAMKQAFLKGINAISEEATIAMDKSERLSMPHELRTELEDRFVADGGHLEDVELGSEDDARHGERRIRIAPAQPDSQRREEFNDESDYMPENASDTVPESEPDYVEEINATATAEIQESTQFDHVIEQPIYVGSPARPVAMHNIMAAEDDKVVGGAAHAASQTKSLTTAYKTNNTKENVHPNLAQRLKGQNSQKAHPSSMIYKESVKEVAEKVKIERE